MRPECRETPKRPAPRWRVTASLLPESGTEIRAILEKLPNALERVWPLSRIHRRELPRDIRDLSGLLTCHRSGLKYNYWQNPAAISAYLYYFLPWNLVRLCRLLPALPLARPELRGQARPLLLDAGSGPLTLPLALWISCPQWRAAPLSLLALDSVRQPLALGKALFEAVAHENGQEPWPIKYVTGAVQTLPAIAPRHTEDGTPLYPLLVTATNLLNELGMTKEMESTPESLLGAWEPLWQAGAQLLLIEPGTRLGGSTIMAMRAAGLEYGLEALSPCTHSNPCPLASSERKGFQPSWCHFTFAANNAPEWLRELSKKAGLFKTSLTLAPLLLARQKPVRLPQDALPCRVISQAFPVQNKPCRYACTPVGLALLPDSQKAVSGSLCLAEMPDMAAKDAKSGAIILEPQGSGNACLKKGGRQPIKKPHKGDRDAVHAAGNGKYPHFGKHPRSARKTLPAQGAGRKPDGDGSGDVLASGSGNSGRGQKIRQR